MRIRKNANLSYLKAVPRIQCSLNQNPWDVMGLSPLSSPLPSPLLLQVNKTSASGINDNFMNHTKPMEWKEFNDDSKKWEHHVDGSMEQPDGKPNNRCRKTDGRTWNCKNEAAQGNKLCEHHLSKAIKYKNSSRLGRKKKNKAAEDTRRSSLLSDNKELRSSSISNNFYNYSSYEPLRSTKIRGVSCGDNAATSLENEQEVDHFKSSQVDQRKKKNGKNKCLEADPN